VRDVDEHGKITGVGLSFEPASVAPRIPVFLSAGEIGDRLRGLIASFRKLRPAEPAPNDAPGEQPPTP